MELLKVWVVMKMEQVGCGADALVGVYHSEKSAEAAAMQAAQSVARGRGVRVEPPRIGSWGKVSTNIGLHSFAWYRKEVQP